MDVYRFADGNEFYREATQRVRNVIMRSVVDRGRCSFVLAGGETPQRLYESLAIREGESDIVWKDVYLFWGDERMVSTDDPESSYGRSYRSLISRIPIPVDNICRVPVEQNDPHLVAKTYESNLRSFFDRDFPVFDLIILGVGADGHTASLFPGDSSLEEEGRWVVGVNGEMATPPLPRVTMTLPLINNARKVIFLVSGAEKMKVVDEILSDQEGSASKYPAAMVKPKGELIWFLLNGGSRPT